MTTQPTPAPTPRTDMWNITRIVAAHDCNHGQIPGASILIAQLEAFHRDELAAKDAEIARLNGVERELTLTLREANNENTELLKERDALRDRGEKAEAKLAQVINRRDILAEQIAALDSTVAEFSKQNSELHAERDQLRAQLAAAQEDKERLDLLEVNAAEVRVEWDDGDGPIPPEFSIVVKGTGVIGRGPTHRAAIDAARRPQP